MHCRGTLHEICSFLRKADLVQLRRVSRLTHGATLNFLPEMEYQWLVDSNVHKMSVELAPPCAVLALTFIEEQRKLLVCTKSLGSGNKLECGIYKHEVTNLGESTRHYIELPTAYGADDSQLHFEGQQFLICKTTNGEILVFDCVLEFPVKLPYGCEGFFASQDGSRFVVIHEGQIHYLESQNSFLIRYPISHNDLLKDSLPQLEIELQLKYSLLSVFLEMGGLVWNTICVGKHSALRLYDGNAFVFIEECSNSKKIISNWSFEIISLGFWGGENMCCTYVTSSGEDEYVIAEFNGGKILFVRPLSRGIIVRELKIPSLRHALIQRFEVVQPSSSYAIVLLYQQIQEVIFFTVDMSLIRRVRIGKPSALNIMPSEGVMIAAPLPHATLSSHPLLEAVESGVGIAFFFILDKESQSELTRRKENNNFSSVELISWVSFGLVTTSLLWTVSALVYNGWWLHLQLLFCGKIT